MKVVNVPDPFSEFLVTHIHLQQEFNYYCEKWEGKEDAKKIIMDFFSMYGLKEECRKALLQSGIKEV